jgi:hypothetical protein
MGKEDAEDGFLGYDSAEPRMSYGDIYCLQLAKFVQRRKPQHRLRMYENRELRKNMDIRE